MISIIGDSITVFELTYFISIFYLFLSFIACILILEVVRAHIDNSDLCTEMFLPSVKICNNNNNNNNQNICIFALKKTVSLN